MADGKQPYAIARRDGAPLAFAGIWEGWRAPDGEVLRTFAILTTSANATILANEAVRLDVTALQHRCSHRDSVAPGALRRGHQTP